jgi:hypothetical protein
MPTIGPISGLTLGRLRNLNATVQSLKATGPGGIFSLSIINASGATAFVQVFDKKAANVVLGVDVPDVEVSVPPNSSKQAGSRRNGIPFVNAISFASTSTEAGAVGSGAGVHAYVTFV